MTQLCVVWTAKTNLPSPLSTIVRPTELQIAHKKKASCLRQVTMTFQSELTRLKVVQVLKNLKPTAENRLNSLSQRRCSPGEKWLSSSSQVQRKLWKRDVGLKQRWRRCKILAANVSLLCISSSLEKTPPYATRYSTTTSKESTKTAIAPVEYPLVKLERAWIATPARKGKMKWCRQFSRLPSQWTSLRSLSQSNDLS